MKTISKEQIQKELEQKACCMNEGICGSYFYCRFCKQPKRLLKNSKTPCADAYLDRKDINVRLKNYRNQKLKLEWEREISLHNREQLQQSIQCLENAIEKLNTKDRFLVLSRYVSQKSWKAVKDSYNQKFRTGVTEKRLRFRMCVIKKQLLQYIQEKG